MIPYSKHTKSYGKSSIEISLIYPAINGGSFPVRYVAVYQRVNPINIPLSHYKIPLISDKIPIKSPLISHYILIKTTRRSSMIFHPEIWRLFCGGYRLVDDAIVIVVKLITYTLLLEKTLVDLIYHLISGSFSPVRSWILQEIHRYIRFLYPCVSRDIFAVQGHLHHRTLIR